MRTYTLPFLILCFTCLLPGCTDQVAQDSGDISAVTTELAAQYESTFPEIIEKHGINTAGIGIIKNGELVWTGYFGEQAPGVSASETTLFNVASITKTVTAETILRLVSQGHVSLDESMAPHWVDPDIEEDARHVALTPRMALNHSTGFLNWRYMDADGMLRLVNDPGTTFGYSGEGSDYVMRFASQKLGQTPETLVQEYIFDPLGMQDASYTVKESDFDRMAKAVDEDGQFFGHYCNPYGYCRNEGEFSAADDMVVTVEAYAKFLIAAMNGTGLSEELIADRKRVQTVKPEEEWVVDCSTLTEEECPQAQGFGLGWEVLDYGDTQVLSHGGSDWAELALGYFYTGSKDGVIIFLNAPNSLAVGAMLEGLLLIDPGSPMINGYQRWYDYLQSES